MLVLDVPCDQRLTICVCVCVYAQVMVTQTIVTVMGCYVGLHIIIQGYLQYKGCCAYE